MIDTNVDDTIQAQDAVNSDWSSPSLRNDEVEQRTFKDVIVLNDGRKMSFTNDTQECFGDIGEYFEFSFE